MAPDAERAEPPTELRRRVEALMSTSTLGWIRNNVGYTPAERWVVGLATGERVFVKAAVNELTAGWLRTEHRVYEDVRGSYMPQLMGWEDGPLPILILEDLSDGVWPPPWDAGRIRAVLATLDELAATEPPRWLPGLESQREELRGWELVAEDRGPFLSLGLCSADWLARALPVLVDGSTRCRLEGSDLLHLDVRSDNICLRHDRAVLVDWNHASVGNRQMDLAFWLPSLATEGGPTPDGLLGDAGPPAAFTSGYLAARAGLPAIPDAPRVREVQLAQLRHALPWAARALGLEAPR